MMHRHHGFSVAFAALALIGCGGEPPGHEPTSPEREGVTGDLWFEEAAREAGVGFRHVAARQRRWWFPEIMGGGVGLGDVDGDGDLDLYCVQSGDLEEGPSAAHVNRLFRNEGGGAFVDATEGSGADDRGYGLGCAFGDADEDGDLDLYVTNLGRNVLLAGDGAGVFTDVTAVAAVGDERWGTSCTFFDYQEDGDLDLFVVNYINWSLDREIECTTSYGLRNYCDPNNYNAPAADVLYRNDGQGAFTDVTEASGLARTFGNGLGVATGDFDADGRLDVYVANDMMANQLWLCRPDGTFVDEALLAGCAVDANGQAEAGMGVLALDVENDGDLDLFMTHLRDQSNTFYLNENGLFADRTATLGLSEASTPFTGFGVGAADFDRDGLLDVYVANGRVTYSRPFFVEDNIFAEPNQLFRGVGRYAFEEVAGNDGLAETIYGNTRGLALGDLDDDGDVDLVLVDNDGPLTLLRNVRAPAGHWIAVRAVTGRGRDAYGALIGAGSGDARRWRQVQAGYGYCSSNDPRAHFGLGDASDPIDVEVRWVDGSRERFGPLDVDRLHTLRQGTGERISQSDRG